MMKLTRRQALAGAAVGLTAPLAGCLPDPEGVEELPRPTLGPDDAPVTVDVYKDYACPACRQFTQTVEPEVKANYLEEEQIQLRFFDWPIPVDRRWSYEVANAARSIQDRAGDDAFWTFHDRVFERQREMNQAVIREEAEALDAIEDVSGVVEDGETGMYRPVIDADKQHGDERGVTGTPAVFVDGQQLHSFDYSAVAGAIDAALEESQ